MTLFSQVPWLFNEVPDALIVVLLLRACRPLVLLTAFWTASYRAPREHQARLFSILAAAVKAAHVSEKRGSGPQGLQ
ncbi:hypothetical protein ACFWUQ_23785 [Streptomyces sp. NPDC058662]|uniref:hypothetical protein n=1 Tax=Streptomyces sp. NPDC058662 TaxID=3346583 RepID=UPI0036580EBC